MGNQADSREAVGKHTALELELADSVKEFLALRQSMIDMGGAKEPFDKEMLRVFAEMQIAVIGRAEAALKKAGLGERQP